MTFLGTEEVYLVLFPWCNEYWLQFMPAIFIDNTVTHKQLTSGSLVFVKMALVKLGLMGFERGDKEISLA